MKGIKEVLAQTIKNDEIVRSEAPMSVWISVEFSMAIVILFI